MEHADLGQLSQGDLQGHGAVTRNLANDEASSSFRGGEFHDRKGFRRSGFWPVREAVFGAREREGDDLSLVAGGIGFLDLGDFEGLDVGGDGIGHGLGTGAEAEHVLSEVLIVGKGLAGAQGFFEQIPHRFVAHVGGPLDVLISVHGGDSGLRKIEQIEEGGGFAAGTLEGAVRLGLGRLTEHLVDGVGVETVGISAVGEHLRDGEAVHVEGAVGDEPAEAIEHVSPGRDAAEEGEVELGIHPGDDGAASDVAESSVVDPVEELLQGDGLVEPMVRDCLVSRDAMDSNGPGLPGHPPLEADIAAVGLAGAGGVEGHCPYFEDAAGDGVEAAGLDVEDDETGEGGGEVHGEGVQGLGD